jgi:hypothetical protein
MFSHFLFVPKNGVAKVLIITRISTVLQDVRSLDAQIEKCKKYFHDYFNQSAEFVIIRSQGSGERLDTAALAEAESLIEGGTIDVVIAEDLGWIMRRARAVDFCELCDDVNTRLITINDAIDTAEKKWRRNALFAAMKHEEANEDTSDRLKRQMDHNFSVSGGCCNHVVWGIEKEPDCENDSGLKWNPLARKLDERFSAWMDEYGGNIHHWPVLEVLSMEKTLHQQTSPAYADRMDELDQLYDQQMLMDEFFEESPAEVYP